jgi:hypothetical protein
MGSVDIKHVKQYKSISGWWFGTWFFLTFHSVGNVIIPNDELIFFRGVETTNQIWIKYLILNINLSQPVS